jgi:hypothetical protein
MKSSSDKERQNENFLFNKNEEDKKKSINDHLEGNIQKLENIIKFLEEAELN